MERTLYSEEHEIVPQVVPAVRRARGQAAPGALARAGQVDREVWRKAGAEGFLCPWLDEKYGGAGARLPDSMIVMEELARVYESGFAMALHSDIIVPYIYSFGTEEQKQSGCRAARRASSSPRSA